MTTTDDLYDPYEKTGGSGPGRDSVNGYERPLRTEDLIPRHNNPNDGRPKIWWPNGSRMTYYSRPSSWGKKAEDTTNLSKWEGRVKASGMLDYGAQSRALRAEWAALGPLNENKAGHDAILDSAKNLVDQAAREGTALHTITERYDLGLEVNPGEDYEPHLAEWSRLTRNFEIVTLPDGRPGVECFVAMDHLRQDMDPTQYYSWVRLAGTFDRLWHYKPCEICGRSNYIGDLKGGKADKLIWSKASFAVQMGIYGNAKLYVPKPDGTGADRYDLPDVCPHNGILVSVPTDTGRGSVHWIDIASGFQTAIDLIPRITAHRRKKNWTVPFTPTPNLVDLIGRAETPNTVRDLWREHPSEEWQANDGALINLASARITELEAN